MQKPEKLINRFEELSALIAEPAIIANQQEWQKYVKEHASLNDIVECYYKFEKLQKEIEDCEQLLLSETNSEMKEMLKEEIEQSKTSLEKVDEEYKILLLPKDENDESNVIMEIRGGAGGEESSLFASVLMRMYTMYSEKKGWKVQIMNLNETELGGVKEAELFISGKGAFRRLKFESGVHRVQRVPETESQGRVHTSTATVAVLPEVKNVNVQISDKDVRVDTYCSGGAGGQHVNKTESACRITHLATGIVASCQDERSLIQNKERCFEILKSKLYDYYQTQATNEYAKNRKSQIGSGDRSERIRTYNYPQGRISDHRINLTLYDLENFVNGDLDEMIDALHMENTKKLLEQNS